MFGEAVRKFIGLSAAQALIGSAVLGGSVLGLGLVSPVVNGCPASVQTYVVRGELALDDHDLSGAKSLADDSRALAGGSPCVNLFAAATEFELMKRKMAAGDAEAAEGFRSNCFLHANRAATLFGPPPRAVALMRECAVAGPAPESADTVGRPAA